MSVRQELTELVPPARPVAILGLFFAGSPAAVVRTVRPVVVDALDGVAEARALANVGKEAAEVGPSLAYRDAASAVAIEVDSARIQAALPHGHPRAVGRGRALVRGVAVSGEGVSVKAAATLVFSAAEVGRPRKACCAAVAATEPAPLALNGNFFETNYGESPESLSNDLESRRHRVLHSGDNTAQAR